MKYIKVTENGETRTIPLEDYLDITAMKYGFDDYKDLQKNHLSIDISPESIFEI